MNNDLQQKRVLLVAYLFPPVGGAGVQRAAKFVKYLPEHGWTPSVLTVANPSVPLFDESLVEDIPENTIIRHAKTWEPGYALKKAVSASDDQANQKPSRLKQALKSAARTVSNFVLQPDSQILWWRNAVREGMQLLKEVPHDAIMVTAPPYSAFLVGATLSRRTGLPLILDYRDEWDISNAYWENKQKEPFSQWIQTRMQHKVVRAADALVATTQSSADSLSKIVQQAQSNATVSHIYNGYDPADFVEPSPENQQSNPNNKFRVAYVGTLWNLTSVEPLVQAIEQLSEALPELAAHLELQFAGRRTGPQDAFLDRLEQLPCTVSRLPYLDHNGAVELMRSADSLCVLMSDVPHAGRVVPAKIFEYMAARRPILSITPLGEVSNLLDDCPLAETHIPADVDGIARTLAIQLERHVAGISTEVLQHDDWDPSQFNRQQLAGKLADQLNNITGLLSPASENTLAPPAEEVGAL